MRLNAQTLLDLVDAGILSAEELIRMLDMPTTDVPYGAVLSGRSRVGQVWEVHTPFTVVNGLVYARSTSPWKVPGDDEEVDVDSGLLLLIVRDGERFGRRQTVMHLESGVTFNADGWQRFACLVHEPESG